MNLETKIFNACIWFISVCVLLVVLTSCSAAVDIPTTPTATARPTSTKAAKHWETFPLTPSPTSESCRVNVGALYLRRGAGMSYAVTKILHAGEQLAVIESGAWLKVETTEHARGWVYSRYCG